MRGNACRRRKEEEGGGGRGEERCRDSQKQQAAPIQKAESKQSNHHTEKSGKLEPKGRLKRLSDLMLSARMHLGTSEETQAASLSLSAGENGCDHLCNFTERRSRVKKHTFRLLR